MKGAVTRDLPVAELPAAAQRLLESGVRMPMVYAWYPPGDTGELRYVVTPAGGHVRDVAVSDAPAME